MSLKTVAFQMFDGLIRVVADSEKNCFVYFEFLGRLNHGMDNCGKRNACHSLIVFVPMLL